MATCLARGLGVLGWMQRYVRVGEAANLVRGAVEGLPMPFLPFEPKKLARKLVTITWATDPALFQGRKGPRPHAISMAAVSLAGGLAYDYDHPQVTRDCIFLALGNVLLATKGNARRYGFNITDLRLLELSERAYHAFDAGNRAAQDQILGSIFGDQVQATP